MTEEQKEFAKQLAAQCGTRECWLTVVDFGRAELLKEPEFFLRLIVDRAEFESKRSASPIGFIVQDLFSKLKLTLKPRSKETDVDEIIKR